MQKKISHRETHRKQIRSLAKSTVQTIYFLTFFSYIFIVSSVFASNSLIHHTLTVTVNPEQSNADIYDAMLIPRSIIQSSPNFRLAKNSKIEDGLIKFKLVFLLIETVFLPPFC